MKFRFFNTFEPVIPLFRLLLPGLERNEHSAEAWMADADYRPVDSKRGFQTRLIPAITFRSRGATRKMLVHMTYAVGVAVRTIFASGVDCNVFLTQPPLFSVWALVLKAVRRQRYCVIAMDLYPWVAFEAGVLRRETPFARLVERLAIWSLRGADAVIVIGRCMASRVHEFGVSPDRIRMVCNWADTEAVRPVERAENGMRSRLVGEDQFVVMYSGNLGVSHDFRDLLDAAERLREHADVRFLIVGDGARRSEIEAAVIHRDLFNVTLLPLQPYEMLSDTLGVADVHFVSLRRGFEGLVVPSKAYAVLAAGRPIVYQGSREGEIARMIEEEQVGLVVAPGDSEGLAAAFLSVRDDSTWAMSIGARARKVAERTYSSARAVVEYTELLERVVQGESFT